MDILPVYLLAPWQKQAAGAAKMGTGLADGGRAWEKFPAHPGQGFRRSHMKIDMTNGSPDSNSKMRADKVVRVKNLPELLAPISLRYGSIVSPTCLQSHVRKDFVYSAAPFDSSPAPAEFHRIGDLNESQARQVTCQNRRRKIGSRITVPRGHIVALGAIGEQWAIAQSVPEPDAKGNRTCGVGGGHRQPCKRSRHRKHRRPSMS